MKVIILAGGKATRLPASAQNIPKAFVEVGGKPVLQHQIDSLEQHGFSDIRLALCHKAEHVISYLSGKYEYVVELEPLGTGGAIRYASRDLLDPFMVVNGDVLGDLNFTAFVQEFKQNPAPHMISVWHAQDARSFGLVHHEAGRVSAFLEKPKVRQAGHINAGVYILSPKDIKKMGEGSFSIERDFFPYVAKGGRLGVYVHEGWWADMGTEERLTEARKYFKSKGAPSQYV